MDVFDKPERFAPWGEHMIPLTDFVKHHVPEESWVPIHEYTVLQHPYSRFKITVEKNTDMSRLGFVLDRYEWLAENLNIGGADADADELAATLMDSLFNNMSVREYEAVIARLQDYVSEFQINRAEFQNGQPLVDMLTTPLPRSK